jgi:poly-D-alanine transfer protein DltD
MFYDYQKINYKNVILFENIIYGSSELSRTHPLCPPLYFVKRGKVTNIQCITPPLFVKQRGGMGGEFM